MKGGPDGPPFFICRVRLLSRTASFLYVVSGFSRTMCTALTDIPGAAAGVAAGKAVLARTLSLRELLNLLHGWRKPLMTELLKRR
jgi:hypothetical protein